LSNRNLHSEGQSANITFDLQVKML
jgi:hypothetical protein